MSALRIIAFIDGASLGNPGPAGVGILLLDSADGAEILRISIPIGNCTNNIAEYTALLEALKKAKELNAEQIEIRSDSQLLVRQMNGEYKIKNSAIAKLAVKAYQLLASFKSYRFVHIGREHNGVADHLAFLAASASTTE